MSHPLRVDYLYGNFTFLRLNVIYYKNTKDKNQSILKKAQFFSPKNSEFKK
jgi:hypothetical protein